jgi:hypothetical protein
MTFTPNYAGIGDMLRSEAMLGEMLRRAEKIMAVAVATAPISEVDNDGEYYVDHFKIEGSRHGGPRNDRAEARVVNTHPAAWAIEYGTGPETGHAPRPQGGQSPRFRTLGKAADAGRA